MNELGKKIKTFLLDGFDLTHGRLSICNVGGYLGRNGWQVHVDNHNLRFSHIYPNNELEIAIDKFCVLKRKIKELEELKKVSKSK